ncbi:MAG: hypothetical protein JWO02_1146 [Solirubrobacterales bacterium]|nr:hypothetical protein [Solirubrobacterales bacterium]
MFSSHGTRPSLVALVRLMVALSGVLVLASGMGVAAAQGATAWTSAATGLVDSDYGAMLAVTSSGDTIVATNGKGGLKVSVTTVGGSAVTTLLSDQQGGQARLLADATGGAYLTWQDASGTEVFFRPDGGSFGSPALVFPGSGSASIATNVAGDAVAVGNIPSNAGYSGNTVVAARRSAGGIWSAPVPISLAGSGDTSAPAVAVAPSGRAVFAWQGVDDQLYLHVYTNTLTSGGAAGMPQILVGADTGSAEPQVAFDTSGRAIIVTARGDGAAYAVAPAGAGFGDVVPIYVRIDNSSDAGFALAAGPDGRVLIAINNSTVTGAFSSPSGVSATIGTLASPLPTPVLLGGREATGAHAAFNADGRALVAFRDRTGTTIGVEDGVVMAAVAEPGEDFGGAAPITCPLPWGTAAAAAGGGAGRLAVLSAPGDQHPLNRAMTLSVGLSATSASPVCPPPHYGVYGDTLVTEGVGHYDVATMLDPGETTAWVYWTVDTIPAGPTPLVKRQIGSGSTFRFSFPARGRHRVSAQVVHHPAEGDWRDTRDSDWSDIRDISVLVDTPPTATVTLPRDRVARTGDQVQVGLIARSPGGGTITSSQLSVDGPTSAYRISAQTPSSITVTFLAPGTYPITATATDDLGLHGSSTTQLRVYTPTTPPSSGTAACLSLKFPKRVSITAARRGIAVRAKSTVVGCATKILLTRADHGIAATRAFSFARAAHVYTIHMRLNPATLRWLQHRRRATFTASVIAGKQVFSGRITLG